LLLGNGRGKLRLELVAELLLDLRLDLLANALQLVAKGVEQAHVVRDEPL
jgi:hypothetical protein